MARWLAGWAGWLILHQPQTPSPLSLFLFFFFFYPGLFLLFLRELVPFLPVVLSGFLRLPCCPSLSAVDHRGKTPGLNLTATLRSPLPPYYYYYMDNASSRASYNTGIVRSKKRRITLFSGRSKHSKIIRLTIHRTKNHGFGPGVGGMSCIYVLTGLLREDSPPEVHYLNLCRWRYPCTPRPRGIDTHSSPTRQSTKH